LVAEKERAMFRALTRALFSTILVGYAAVATAQEEPSRPAVRLSYIPGNFALPVLVAIEHGIFAHEGLSVSPVPVTDEGAILRSLAAGGTDFAVGSQSTLISVAGNRLEAKVVAIAGAAREIDLVVPIWDTTTKKFADIKGKTVALLNGVHNFDAVPELYRALALSKPPMKLSDVSIQFVDLANLQVIMDPRAKQVYTQRNLAGVLMLREFTKGYVDEKKARVVFSNEELTKLIGRHGAQPLFASKLVLTRFPKTVERFVRAWARTMHYVSDPANKAAVVRVLQIYYLRQYGYPLKKELAEQYIANTDYRHVVWTKEDIAEVNINAKALSAARNLLFARIKEPEKRPFKTPVEVDAYVEMAFAKKAIADIEAEKKASEVKPGSTPNKSAPVDPAPGKVGDNDLSADKALSGNTPPAKEAPAQPTPAAPPKN
jgi:ABC-type nitrate/sulfonate/bicarbonate transport system substrate-binding protein